MTKPNLIFIMTDQQRYDALGANGNDIIYTPNLDALAKSGVNFQNYYVNCPVCVPSRCTLFTGRYPHSHQVRENHNLLESGREIHLFRALKKAGYSLGYVGKNHLLEREEFQNFDYTDVWKMDHKTTSGEKAYADFLNEHYKRTRHRGLWACPVFHDLPPEESRPYLKASSAIQFLEERPEDKPFCLCLSFSDPHVPHLALRKFESMYPPEKMKLYPAREGELEEKARRFLIKWRAQQADIADEAGMRHYMAVYYAMISWVDEQIGRVLDALKAQKLEDKTIVVFTSDHGEFCFEHGMFKKDLVLLESLLHVSLIISWPGQLDSCIVSDTFMEAVDVMPTLLDIMDLEIPFGVQGRSILPYLHSEVEEHKDAVYGEICPPWLYNRFPNYEAFEAHHGKGKVPMNVPGDYNKCVRDSDFRYIWYGTGEEELYDLRDDPEEAYNRAREHSYADTKLRMKLRLLEWHALTEDPLDPLSIRQLQAEYGDWISGRVSPGVMAGPGWLDERFTPNPKVL